MLEIPSFSTCVPKITITWCKVPEIQSETNRIFCHFGPFFVFLPPKKSKLLKNEKKPGDIIILHNCTKNHDHILYGSWDMARNICKCYFSFWVIFCPFTSLTAWKIKIKKKNEENTWTYHHFTIEHQKSWSYAILFLGYGTRGCNYFSFWVIFCPFTSVTAQRIKTFKKWKNHLEISSIYRDAPKIMIICYTVPEIWCMTDVMLFFILGYFLPFYPLIADKINITKKKEKKHLEISLFHICIPKLMIRWCTVPEILSATDGWTKKVTYRGGVPYLKKNQISSM